MISKLFEAKALWSLCLLGLGLVVLIGWVYLIKYAHSRISVSKSLIKYGIISLILGVYPGYALNKLHLILKNGTTVWGLPFPVGLSRPTPFGHAESYTDSVGIIFFFFNIIVLVALVHSLMLAWTLGRKQRSDQL